MIYLISVCIVCLSGVIGREIVKRYVLRDKFYKELNELIEYIKNNLSYNQSKVEEIFDGFIKSRDCKFSVIITKMKNTVIERSGSDDRINNKVLYFLTKEEYEMIQNFLKEFGESGIEVELNKLIEFKKYLSNKINEVSIARNKNEGLIYKLSLAIGVVICILIV